MVNVIKVATELNKLEIKKGTLIDLKDINKYNKSVAGTPAPQAPDAVVPARSLWVLT